MYKKTSGAADGAGESFECKMLTLVFLRMLSAGHEFQLASNMDAAGLFDDIVLRHLCLRMFETCFDRCLRTMSSNRLADPDHEWDVSYVQLKHKKNTKKCIPKVELLDVSGDFSLVKYCDSYETMKSSGDLELRSFGNFDKHKICLFTNARINESLVDELESDPLLSTGGKVVSFKAGGEVYQGLCEWVDFKEALTELHGQVDGLKEEEARNKVIVGLENTKFTIKPVKSFKNELLKSPTLEKLRNSLKKLAPVSDKATYSSFLAKLRVYMDQAHESQLDAKIKEQLDKAWNRSENPSTSFMLHALQSCVKTWWQKDNFYLTETSPLWLGIVKSQTDNFSKSTIDPLTKTGVEFAKDSLRVLHEAISADGIVNVRVESRTAASSLRVHQALAEFRAEEIVLHVNLQAFLEREADVLAAWASRWCRVLVLVCNREIEQSKAEMIAARIQPVIGEHSTDKLLVLIAPESHQMNVLLQDLTKQSEHDRHQKYTHFYDCCKWEELKDDSKEIILATCTINKQGTKQKLSELLLDNDKVRLGEQANLEVISQLLTGVICGKILVKKGDNFVGRRLNKKFYFDQPFVVNSVHDVHGSVVLVVAEAGMGKSTLMTYLANRAKTEDPEAWVVHIKLNDCTEYLDAIDKVNINEDAARNFLEHFALSSGNDFEKFLFLSLERKLVVFLDGVDEVCPDYQQEVFTLLGFIKRFKFAKLWVASRPVSRKQLEVVLGVMAYHLEPFSEKEQTEFFNNAWKMKKVPNISCKERIDKLQTLLANLHEKDREILGVPLITAMVAEVYHNFKGELVKSNRLSKMFLYQKYVEQRFQILYLEKMKTENPHGVVNRRIEADLKERIHRGHCLAALRALFRREDIGRLKFGNDVNFDEDLAKFLAEVTDGKEKIGIIDYVMKDVPLFTHRSLAEYFAALWMKNNLGENKEFTKRITTISAFNFISQMFNQLLSEGQSLHCAVFDREVEETERLLSDELNPFDVNAVDAGGRTALHLAVLLSATDPHEDCVAIVEILVQHKARADIADTIANWTPLQYAEHVRAWKALEIFLKNGIKNIESWPIPDKDTMFDAARHASASVVRYLAEDRGGDLLCRFGWNGESMVHVAAQGGNVDTLKYLAEKGLSLHETDKENNTALHHATHNDSVSVVRFLLNNAVDCEAVNSDGLTAFHFAAEQGAYQVMDVLLENGASAKVTQSIEQHKSSLLCAAFAGDLESVKHLIEMKDHYRYHRNKKGHSAAWFAMHRGHLDVMNCLLLRGTEEGDTPLHGACRWGESEVVSFLISQPDSDIVAKGWEGKTPLHKACLWSHSDSGVIQLLLSRGADTGCRDNHGNTPLHTVSSCGTEEDMELLLSRVAEVDVTNDKGQTPLHCASRKSNLAAIELLLSHGADIESRDEDGNTPLHVASLAGMKLAVELLLSHGAKGDARNSLGKTPLEAATRVGESTRSKPVVKRLEAAAARQT